jgi:hydroxymethylbilane synthase
LIVLATRGSALALAQAELALAEIRRRRPGLEVRLEVVESDGDLSPSTAVAELAGDGWFTSKLERELADGRVDGVVHSAKDLPSELAPGLIVGAYLKREDPRDSIVTRVGLRWIELDQGAVVGTSSARRSAQLTALRADLQVVPMRGNVDTRLRRVSDGELDAVMLAQAGLLRIGKGDLGQPLDPHLECTPAPAQGAIALEVRAGSSMEELCSLMDDASTRLCVEAERAVLKGLGGGCLLPLGALAEPTGNDRYALTVAWLPPGSGSGLVRRSGLAAAASLTRLAEGIAADLSS